MKGESLAVGEESKWWESRRKKLLMGKVILMEKMMIEA